MRDNKGTKSPGVLSTHHLVRRGTAHKSCRLTEPQVQQIRKRYDRSEPIKDIAKDFGVTFQHVSKIGLRQFWASLPEDLSGQGEGDGANDRDDASDPRPVRSTRSTKQKGGGRQRKR